MAPLPDSEIPSTFLTCAGVPIEAWIEVDGEKVPHHAVEYDVTKKEVSCWIESKVDKPFVMKYKYTTVEYATTVRTSVDGSEVSYTINLPHNVNTECSISGARIAPTEVQAFKFGSLELTDDDAYLEKPAKSPYFGEIRMVFDKKSDVKPSSRGIALYGIPEISKVHEKSKKGLTHHIKFGEKMLVATPVTYSCTRCGILVTFVFKYRPLEMLQAHDIVMRDPDPSTSSQGSDEPGSMKRKEMDEQEESDKEDSADEEEKALLAQLEKVRQEKLAKEAEASTRKKIKLEPKAHFLPGEIIDLTDDTPTGKSLLQPKVPKTPAPVVDLT